jgi:hypothetical protein
MDMRIAVLLLIVDEVSEEYLVCSVAIVAAALTLAMLSMESSYFGPDDLVLKLQS